MEKSIDIFYKSYSKDFKLLHYSLESLKKYITGYTNVVILIPAHEMHLFDVTNLPERTIVQAVEEHGNGYLFQQWCKISAHNYCQSDFILFADSDCIFNYEQNLQNYIIDDKPEILYTDWAKVGDAGTWRKPTEKFMRDAVPFEFMRRNCLIYHRSTLININEFDPELKTRILYSDRFSEFNAMGAYAYKYEPDKYNFVNTDNWQYTEPKAIQLWSWFNAAKTPIHVQEKQRAINTINEVLGLQITDL